MELENLLERANRLCCQLKYLIQTNPELDICHILNKQDGSLREFHQALILLQEEGFCELKDGKIIQKHMVNTPVGLQATCKNCSGVGFRRDPPSTKESPSAFQDFLNTTTNRPAAREEYDQWPMDGENAFFRVNFFHDQQDLLDKELLFIGDDDLVSIAAALTRLPKRVLVLEYDAELVSFINSVSKDFGLGELLSARVFDVREPFPEELIGKFDVFACDPVETIEGIKLFLSRGIHSLKGPGSSCYFGLTTLEASKKKWHQIQKMILEMNFAVTEIMRNFTEYPDPGWESKLPIWQQLKTKPTCTWYKSALWRIQAIAQPKPLVIGVSTETDIYVDEEAWATTTNKNTAD